MLTTYFHAKAPVPSAHGSRNTRRRGRLVQWSLRIAAIAPIGLVIAFGSALQPPVFMWLLAVAVFAACKAITFIDAWTTGRISLNARGMIYLFAWPGMDTAPFADRAPTRPPNGRQSAWPGVCQVAVGAIALWTLPRLLIDHSALAAGWTGMIATGMLLHFGVFRLLAVALQRAGINAPSIMDAPFAAANIAEFWSKRWNRAFNVLAHRWVLRPMTRRLNLTFGLLAAFAFSGVIHDLVITLPLGSDLGKPTLFFMLQAAAVMLSRSRLGKRIGLNRGVLGRAFCLLMVIAPAGLCFPPAFVTEIALPWFEMIGAVELPANP